MPSCYVEPVRLARLIPPQPAGTGWTLSQPGVEHALVGARKVEQVIEIAEAQPLETSTLEEINRITRESQLKPSRSGSRHQRNQIHPQRSLHHRQSPHRQLR